jgi:hypothetical protein
MKITNMEVRMSRITKFAWLFTAIVMLSLTACGGGTATTPTQDPAAVYTAAVETAYAQLTLTAMSATNTPEATALPPSPTQTLGNTNTPLATGVPLNTTVPLTALPTNTPFSLTPIVPTQQSCDTLLFISDITVPDGSVMNPGEVFDKTWEIQNTGPCAWNTNYYITYGYGEVMGANVGDNYNFFHIFPTTVKVGDIVDVTITLKAPTTSGSYVGVWTMANDKGYYFGTLLTVSIKVP